MAALSGTLLKRGRLKFDRRFFTLPQGGGSVFSYQTSEAEKRPHYGSLEIAAVRDLAELQASIGEDDAYGQGLADAYRAAVQQQHLFEVAGVSAVWVLAATSEADKDTWVSALRERVSPTAAHVYGLLESARQSGTGGAQMGDTRASRGVAHETPAVPRLRRAQTAPSPLTPASTWRRGSQRSAAVLQAEQAAARAAAAVQAQKAQEEQLMSLLEEAAEQGRQLEREAAEAQDAVAQAALDTTPQPSPEPPSATAPQAVAREVSDARSRPRGRSASGSTQNKAGGSGSSGSNSSSSSERTLPHSAQHLSTSHLCYT